MNPFSGKTCGVKDKKKVIIVIPTYNERRNIRPLVVDIREALPKSEILFVDDGSPDDTSVEIRSLMQMDKRIFLLERKGKLGLGSAYREAFAKIAKEEDRADVVVTMDADRSHPAEVLPRMIALLSDCDMVIGSRYIPSGDVKNWSWWRRILSLCANIYVRILTRMSVHDSTSGFSVMKASVLFDVHPERISSDGYAFQVELKYLFWSQEKKIHEYPIIFSERRDGKSKLPSAGIFEAMMLPIRIFFW